MIEATEQRRRLGCEALMQQAGEWVAENADKKTGQ